MLDQPTDSPVRWAMKPSIREVVVLPLVPVTATTGIRGLISSGAEPGGVRARRSAACSSTLATSAPSPAVTASRTAVTPSASISARAELRHG